MKDEIDKFLQTNDVDERSSNDLRDCPPEVQRIVLSRGDLSTARNPSAALIARIRDARHSIAAGPRDSRSMGGSGDPEVESFLRSNEVDESAAASLRSCSSEVQRTVIARGDLTGARNPSSALLSRIRDAKQGGSDRGGGYDGPRDSQGYGSGYGGGGGYGAYSSPNGGAGLGGLPPPPGYPQQYGSNAQAGAYSGSYGMYPGYYAMQGYGMPATNMQGYSGSGYPTSGYPTSGWPMATAAATGYGAAGAQPAPAPQPIADSGRGRSRS